MTATSNAAVASRWSAYGSPAPAVASGWQLDEVVAPAATWGANGILVGPTNELIVTQVFGAHVTAIDVDSGVQRAFSPQGDGITAPDDGAFTADGTFFATEPPNGRVTGRRPDGSSFTLRDDLPSANGMTVDHTGRRLFVDEFRPGGRLLELDPTGDREPTVLADELDMPNAFAMGPDGALWFPQVLAGEIWRRDLDTGALERRFTDLATPTAVKFDADGRLLTSEAGSGQLTAIELGSGARTTLAEVDKGIDNFAIGPDGRLYVSHFTNGRVAEVTGGVERRFVESGLIGPFGLAVLGDGRIASADALAVNVSDLHGTPTVVASLLGDLPGVAVDVARAGDPGRHGQPGDTSDDLLVLMQRGQVLRRRATDGALRSVAGFLKRVTAMAEAPGGGAYVVEAGPGRIIAIDGASDAQPSVVVENLDNPRGLAAAADGSLWVAHRSGVTGFVDGRPTMTIDAVADPCGVAVTPSTVVITDPGRRAVVAIDRSSGAVATVVTDLPIGPPVSGARLPHSFSPAVAVGDAVLVGCDGDGSIRRLTPPG
ncbi:MAG: SMP-30/gluconolactonase/LRE family protein [Actinomycetota bacterium]